jgi:hypothetical protein
MMALQRVLDGRVKFDYAEPESAQPSFEDDDTE